MSPASDNAAVIAARIDVLEAAAELALDFWAMDTQKFVAKYGHGMTTKMAANRIRKAIASATGVRDEWINVVCRDTEEHRFCPAVLDPVINQCLCDCHANQAGSD